MLPVSHQTPPNNCGSPHLKTALSKLGALHVATPLLTRSTYSSFFASQERALSRWHIFSAHLARAARMEQGKVNTAPNPALPDQQKWPSEWRAGAHKHTGLPQQQASAAVQPQKIERRSLTTTTPRPGLGLSAPLHARGVTHWGSRFKSAAQAKLRFDRAGLHARLGGRAPRTLNLVIWTLGSHSPMRGCGDHEQLRKQFFLPATAAATLLGFRPESLMEKRSLICANTARPAAGRMLAWLSAYALH